MLWSAAAFITSLSGGAKNNAKISNKCQITICKRETGANFRTRIRSSLELTPILRYLCLYVQIFNFTKLNFQVCSAIFRSCFWYSIKFSRVFFPRYLAHWIKDGWYSWRRNFCTFSRIKKRIQRETPRLQHQRCLFPDASSTGVYCIRRLKYLAAHLLRNPWI